MSVTSVAEIKEGRSGEWSLGGGRRWTRTFRVVTDDDRDGGPTVVQASGLPALGTFYLTPEGEVDTQAVLQSLVPTQDDQDARLWTVTASYDTQVSTTQQSGGGSGTPGGGGAHPATRPDNPLDRPVTWSAATVKAK